MINVNMIGPPPIGIFYLFGELSQHRRDRPAIAAGLGQLIADRVPQPVERIPSFPGFVLRSRETIRRARALRS